MELKDKIEERIEELKEEVNKEDTVDTLQEFFSMLLGSKLVGHIHHLRTEGEGSYARHKALNEFYDTANEIADTIIETYQGCKSKLVTFDNEALVHGTQFEDPLEYLTELRWVIEDGRKHPELAKESHIQNEIDNFITLIDQTVYKLTFLK